MLSATVAARRPDLRTIRCRRSAPPLLHRYWPHQSVGPGLAPVLRRNSGLSAGP